LNNEVKKGAALGQEAYNALLVKLSAANAKMFQNNLAALRQFLKQYPNSEVSAHLMSKLNYEDDPVTYYNIYKTLTPAARNSDDGKEVGDKLKQLVKLVVGAKAPEIYGKMPDGKPFDPKTLNKKYILIDFWRAGNDFSRKNHERMINLLGQLKDKGELGIVSISLDTRKDWWTTAIKDDHMTWPQVADLKGDDSPNATNWSISTIPTYYLLDSNWKIVERNIDMGNVTFEVDDYMRRHH
jgi:hypothetical protein